MKTYSGLSQLLADDANARRYHDNLPDYVRDQMSQRADSINSIKSLMDYAQNLTRGDN